MCCEKGGRCQWATSKVTQMRNDESRKIMSECSKVCSDARLRESWRMSSKDGVHQRSRFSDIDNRKQKGDERAWDQHNGRQYQPKETRAQRRKGREVGRRQMDACSYIDPASESTG
eukprot:4213040-Heterocapsa_arctica.AAC.1